MYHPRFYGNHYEMGRKLGNIFRKNKVQFPIKLDPFQIKHGRKCVELLKKHFPEVIASSCNIISTDKDGKMVVVECNPRKINIRNHKRSRTRESFIISVNHFTSKDMWKYDASDRNVYLSENRYQTVYNALMGVDCSDGIEYAKDILSGKYGFICQYDKQLNFDTIWSSVFDISNKRLYRAEGNPSRVRYKEDTRLH